MAFELIGTVGDELIENMKISFPLYLMYNPTFLQKEHLHLAMQNLHFFAIDLLGDKLTKSTWIIILWCFGVAETF